jgi:hypothetical protein
MAFPVSDSMIAAIMQRDPTYVPPTVAKMDMNDPYVQKLGWTDGAAAWQGSPLSGQLPMMGTTPVGQAVQMNTPQTGLMGSEQALMQYFQQAMNQLNQSNTQSAQQMQQGFQQALGQIQQGLQGSEAVMREQNAAAMGQIQNPVTVGTGGAEGILAPLIAPGAQANRQQAALSGALGPEEQARAMQAFQNSPGQQYLREQAERSVLRNASATGNLGSGNVLMELQRQGAGLAAQDFDNAFNRLGQVSDRGANAMGALSGITSGAARETAGINASRDMARAELSSGLGNILGGQRFDAGRAGAEGAFTLGQNLGQNTLQTGRLGADLSYGTGMNLAAGRTRAGEQMAGQYAGTAQQIANLQNQLGAGTADLIGSNTGNLAQLLAAQGGNEQQMQQLLATLLANIATGSGTQIAGLPGIPGVQNQPGILGGLGQLAQGAAAAKTAWG